MFNQPLDTHERSGIQTILRMRLPQFEANEIMSFNIL